jgi:hypothetical protein
VNTSGTQLSTPKGGLMNAVTYLLVENVIIGITILICIAVYFVIKLLIEGYVRRHYKIGPFWWYGKNNEITLNAGDVILLEKPNCGNITFRSSGPFTMLRDERKLVGTCTNPDDPSAQWQHVMYLGREDGDRVRLAIIEGEQIECTRSENIFLKVANVDFRGVTPKNTNDMGYVFQAIRKGRTA